ncbi:MAG: response regulator [Hyphomicrobiales bacterium]|nr:response regulator [Hyphomicrobiales bacterium]
MSGHARACVLLVENDSALADTLSLALMSQGHSVERFPDFRGALALIESDRKISVMVTSVRLPAGTPHGIALANMAAQKRPHLPIVFIACDADAAQWIDERWKHVLIKPVQSGQLLEAIERALGTRSPSHRD